jgi:hypothetical protein
VRPKSRLKLLDRPAGRRATCLALGEVDEERPMGMDIYGRNPTDERGRYFRNTIDWWHPLARYLTMIAPDICAPCRYWHANEGDGLDAAGAVALADALQKEVDAGRTETYARRNTSEREMMPNEPCDACAGTGVRNHVRHRGAGENPFLHCGVGHLKEGGKCCRCQGTGYIRPWISEYEFSTENVADFVAFLRKSGGFSIW